MISQGEEIHRLYLVAFTVLMAETTYYIVQPDQWRGDQDFQVIQMHAAVNGADAGDTTPGLAQSSSTSHVAHSVARNDNDVTNNTTQDKNGDDSIDGEGDDAGSFTSARES